MRLNLLLLPQRPSSCINLLMGSDGFGPEADGLSHTLHWIHKEWSSIRE